MAVVEVDSVTKQYPGGVTALAGVSFQLQPGERACLLGPNGAGKTTLIRLLVGALQPTAGRVRLFGAEPSGRAFLDSKRRMGVVPQSPGMYRDLDVLEYLRLVRDLYGRGDIDEVLTAFGLTEYATRRMSQLSGGWQRRLALAAALLPRPEILLLDEPTAGLDPIATLEVHAYLRKMMPGRAVLLCTHNLLEAERLCETAVILRQGKALLHERIDQLRARAHQAVLLNAKEGAGRLAAELERLGRAHQSQEGGVRVPLDSPIDEAPALLRQLLQAGVNVYESRLETPSLEELFVGIVGAEEPRA